MKNSLSALSLPSAIDWKEALEIPTKSEERGGIICGKLYHNPGVDLRLFFGSLLVSLLDFSLSLVQWGSRSVLRMRRLLVVTALVHGQFFWQKLLWRRSRVSQEGDPTRITGLFLTFCNRPASIHLRGIPSTFTCFVLSTMSYRVQLKVCLQCILFITSF